MISYERSWWWAKQKKHMALVFITVMIILQFQMKGCVGCLETERMGLLQLKSYFNSHPSPQKGSFLKSWSNDDPKSDCCNWERLKCSAIGGHIVYLSLDGLMYFDLPHQALNLSLLHSFPQLKTLNLSLNQFGHLFDPIHGYKSFQRLENLETLDLSGNNFNDSVLPFLSAPRSLRILNLGANNLQGVFPSNGYKSFQRLENLETLDLSYNYFNNSFLPFLSAARSVRTLILHDNTLKGVFPPNELAQLSELRVLNLRNNEFSVLSAQGLFNFTELEELDLSFNSINDFEAGDGLRTTKLKTLDLRGNQFSDTAQLKGLEHLVELEVLILAHNKFNNTRSIQGYSKLCGLMNLQELDLSNNDLTSMPYCLGNLSRLRILDLSDNQLNGNLSAFVSSLPSAIEYLLLLHNNFNGSFLFNSLVNQTRLTIFRLSSKVGMIQAQAESSLVPLFQLKMLTLHNFSLGSTIPSFLVHQHDLYVVDLSNNKLTGAFPTWLVENNTRLQTILLNSNSLTEFQLPRLVHGLQVLDISSNRIYDSIQEDIGIVFPKLKLMNFSSNRFHGTIPSSMGEMKSLETLEMSSNALSGELPKTVLSSCYSLRFMKLSNNQFHGEIFPEHANLTGLGMLLLDGNNFDGSLGKGLLNSKELQYLDMSDNSFSGTIPLWIGRLSRLVILNMRGNQLKGPFPHQLQSRWLEFMDISHNSFSGSIPRNVNFPSLKILRLQNNDFTGSIPDNLFKAEALQVLDLRNNNFSGNILNTIGERSNLLVLLLRNNSLQSHIPDKICQLSRIGLMDLSHNKFKGAIPSCLGNMSFGAEGFDGVWALGTSFFFPFLENWDYSSALKFNEYLRFVSESTVETAVEFLTKSRYEAYQGDILNYMTGLDLSSNQLSGDIPVEIGDLQGIKSLNLSSNHLTGSIPYSISKLKDVESLDLSNNMLNGNIPPVLADLSSLGYFNVSCNNLSGEIPFKGQLVTFEERSYIGNPHLCGLPTNKKCNPTRVLDPSASTYAKDEEDGVINMVWFYWTCGAVYISTSLALFVFLCIDSRWSKEWFYRVDLFIHHLQCYKRSSLHNN